MGSCSSTLALYKELLRLRRERELGTGSLVWEDLGSDAVAFRRGDMHVAVNLGEEPIELGADGDVTFLVQSQPFDGTALPADTAAWFTRN